MDITVVACLFSVCIAVILLLDYFIDFIMIELKIRRLERELKMLQEKQKNGRKWYNIKLN